MKRRCQALSAAAFAAVFLTGCGQREAPIPVEKSVFGDQVEQIDKAKEVNKLQEGRMDDLNKKLGDSGG